jgi:hypothetical protein
MEERKEVVFKEDTRVTTGAQVVRFKAGIPRKVHPVIVAVALELGAEMVKKPRKKRAPKRDA